MGEILDIYGSSYSEYMPVMSSAPGIIGETFKIGGALIESFNPKNTLNNWQTSGNNPNILEQFLDPTANAFIDTGRLATSLRPYQGRQLFKPPNIFGVNIPPEIEIPGVKKIPVIGGSLNFLTSTAIEMPLYSIAQATSNFTYKPVKIPGVTKVPIIGSLLNGVASVANSAVRGAFGTVAEVTIEASRVAGKAGRLVTQVTSEQTYKDKPFSVGQIPTRVIGKTLGITTQVVTALPVANQVVKSAASTVTTALRPLAATGTALQQIATGEKLLPANTGLGLNNPDLQALVVLAQASGTVAGLGGTDKLLTPDKLLHAAGSSAMYLAAYGGAKAVGVKDPGQFAALASLGVGGFKEIIDASGKGTPSTVDMLANISGIGLGQSSVSGVEYTHTAIQIAQAKQTAKELKNRAQQGINSFLNPNAPSSPNNTPARSGSGSTTPRRQFNDPDDYKGARLLNRR